MRELGAACIWLGFAVMLDDIGARPVVRWLVDELEGLDRPPAPPWIPSGARTRYAAIDEDDDERVPMDEWDGTEE